MPARHPKLATDKAQETDWSIEWHGADGRKALKSSDSLITEN
jgi:hypothetical protein